MIKKIIKRTYHMFVNTEIQANYTGQPASDKIKEGLLKNKPLMIARFGSTELRTIIHIKKLESDSKNLFLNLKTKEIFRSIENASGFFPATHSMLKKFTELMIQDMKYLDILGTWRKEEKFFEKELSHTIKIRLRDIEPYYHQDPWSEILEGKKVLVIHPFSESIIKQYNNNRELLFKDPRILPKFELSTIKAVQSIAGNRPGYKTWFEALDFMKKQIEKEDFDIALVGCGAYGFPLAAHIKRIGKKAIHMAGATQIMFGIFGNRWEKHPVISLLRNEHWVRPMSSETPKNYNNVEKSIGTNGPYW